MIASANWSQDLNDTTVSEKSVLEVAKVVFGARANVPNQRNWHAFIEKGREEESSKRQAALWDRVERGEDETQQLVYLGQLLHFAQDAFAHHGYEPGLGHGLATILGNDPDALQNQQLDMGMVKATTEFLFKECDKLGRGHEKAEDVEKQVEPLVEKLIQPSSLGWRFSSRQADLAHVLENVHALGQALGEQERDVIPRCWATTMGKSNELARQQRVIPSPIKIEYDKTGEPTNLEAVRSYMDDIKSSVEKCDAASPAQPILLSQPSLGNVPLRLLVALGVAIFITTLVL